MKMTTSASSQEGSPEALPPAELDLERLFETEAPRMVRALFAFTRDWDIAADAMAEAFAQALASKGTLRSPRKWVWSVAYRIAAGQAKERRRLSASIDQSYEMEEPEWQLVEALARLSPNQRAALILRYYSGYLTKEISQIMGCSAVTVRVHISQGRRRLARILQEVDRP